MDSLKNRIEAVLYATEEPRTVRWLASYFKTDGKIVRKALEELRREYDVRQGALEVREVLRAESAGPAAPPAAGAEGTEPASEAAATAAGEADLAGLDGLEDPVAGVVDDGLELAGQLTPEGPVRRVLAAYEIAIRWEYREVVQRLCPPELGKPVLATLSMIAARQPILQSEIIRIRGKRAYAHMKELMEQRLVHRKAVQGTFALGTTAEFARRYRIDPEVAKKLREAKLPDAAEDGDDEGDEGLIPPVSPADGAGGAAGAGA